MLLQKRGADRVPHRKRRYSLVNFCCRGNCRNKKYCRFSHHIQARVSPERKSRDGRWGLSDAGPAWDGPKWTFSSSYSADPVISEKPYDPIHDSRELRNSNNPVFLLPNKGENTSVDGKVDKPSNVVSPSSFPSGANDGNDYLQAHNSVEPKQKNFQLSQLEPLAKSDIVKGNSEFGAQESKNVKRRKQVPRYWPLGGHRKRWG
ncbi:hypothetical protein GBA52_028447 [Prunus armeniaca]|nr:hypothetical protein GBA52_028447 [Prunus armeniaca]